MKKKVLALILCGILVVSGLTACGGKEEPAASVPASEEPAEAGSTAKEEEGNASSQGVTLTFMASQDWVYDAEMELGQKFEQETGIKIDYQIIPSDQYYTVLMTKLNSGEGPDIFGGQSGTYDIVSQYNVEKNAVDLSNESWVGVYDEFAKQQTSTGGVLYGATYFDTTTDFYMVYNKKIFEEYNLQIPANYQEYLQVCQTLLDNEVMPFFECMGDGWHHVMWFCEIGGKFEELVPGIVDKLNNNEIKFADVPEFKTCLEQMKEMADKGYFGDNYLSDEYADMPAALGSGEFAMTMAKPGTISEIAAASNGAYTEDDFGMFLIPTLDNDVLNVHPCGPTRFIYSGSQHIEEAKQYLEFMASQESVQYMIDNEPKVENLPYNVGQTPAYSEYTQNFLASCEKSGTVFQDSIKYLNPQWFEFGQDMIAMLIGDMDADQVLQAVDQRRETQAVAAGDHNWD